MPPKPLRIPSRKAAAALPEGSRLTFLLDAAKLLTPSVPELASYLGACALKWANAKRLQLPRGTAHVLCVKCGGRMGTRAAERTVRLSRSARRRRARRQHAAGPSGRMPDTVVPQYISIGHCQVCGHAIVFPAPASKAAKPLGEQAAHPLVSAPRSPQLAHNSCLPKAPQPPPPAKDAGPQPQQQVADAEDKPQALPSEPLPTKSTMNTIGEAASKAQHYQEQAATAERDGQEAGAQAKVASEKACVMDMPQVPANKGTLSDSAVTQVQVPMVEARGLVQQQAGEPELKPMAAEVHGLQQHSVQANDTANTSVNNEKAPVHGQQLMHGSRQAVKPTKHSQRSRWRRYGRFWRWI